MSIVVYAHVRNDAEVTVELQENKGGRYVTLGTGGLTVFINDREKLLEVASLLEQAAQEWEGEE